MYKSARKEAGLSLEEASCRLHIGRRTLVNYENGHTIIPTELVVKMAEVYNKPEMLAMHCAKYCPIGQIIAQIPRERNIATTVLSFLKEFEDVNKQRNRLIEITCDGELDDLEMPDFMNILREIKELKQSIDEIEQIAVKKLGLDAYKEKAPEMSA